MPCGSNWRPCERLLISLAAQKAEARRPAKRRERRTSCLPQRERRSLSPPRKGGRRLRPRRRFKHRHGDVHFPSTTNVASLFRSGRDRTSGMRRVGKPNISSTITHLPVNVAGSGGRRNTQCGSFDSASPEEFIYSAVLAQNLARAVSCLT